MTIREVRRNLHRHPETGWCEFRTTGLIAAELDDRGYKVHLGPDAINVESRLGVPSDRELRTAANRAREEGVPKTYLEAMDGVTGLVAEKTFGRVGPVVGIRVDMDALEVTEATSDEHRPARAGFVSEYPGTMHACGHDGHTAIGLGVARAFEEVDDFDGTLKLFFQPAEEGSRGGQAMSQNSHLTEVDYLFALHLGFGRETGTVIAGFDRPLANARFDVTHEGSPSHAGNAPDQGNNALQAAMATIQNLYAISRHGEGVTRINVGRVRSPNPQNVVAERAEMRVEVRGETTAIRDWMVDRAKRVIDGAATMYATESDIDRCGLADSFVADERPVNAVVSAAREHPAVDTTVRRDQMGASDDAANLIRRVQQCDGEGTYVLVGASNPDGHHTPRFDIDEDALNIGVEILTAAIRNVS